MSVHHSQMSIERDISDFKECLNEFSKKINAAGCLWNDSKYFELRNSVSRIASESRGIIRESEQLHGVIMRFMNICSEEW
ncbi:MAG: hypothetical protein HDT47_09555 [Ruminococcaceae bacterium]|nr:hypothetical protein [Oscillospiraceae bacterium]